MSRTDDLMFFKPGNFTEENLASDELANAIYVLVMMKQHPDDPVVKEFGEETIGRLVAEAIRKNDQDFLRLLATLTQECHDLSARVDDNGIRQTIIRILVENPNVTTKEELQEHLRKKGVPVGPKWENPDGKQRQIDRALKEIQDETGMTLERRRPGPKN